MFPSVAVIVTGAALGTAVVEIVNAAEVSPGAIVTLGGTDAAAFEEVSAIVPPFVCGSDTRLWWRVTPPSVRF
jgi:hypothetical protein